MNVAMNVMISIVALVSNVICPFVQKSVNQDVNVLLVHIKIDLGSVFPLVMKRFVPLSKNAQTTKFGICVAIAVKISFAVRMKNVFLHPVLPDAILVVNVLMECTQVRGILICVLQRMMLVMHHTLAHLQQLVPYVPSDVSKKINAINDLILNVDQMSTGLNVIIVLKTIVNGEWHAQKNAQTIGQNVASLKTNVFAMMDMQDIQTHIFLS